MRQSLSWIDQDALRAGLRELAPASTAHPLVELAWPRPDLASRDRMEAPPGPLRVAAGPGLFTLPAGPIPERLEAFVQWVGAHLGTERLFLVGQEGLCLAPVEAAPQLVVASAWVMDVWERARHVLGGKSGGSVVFQVTDGPTLLLVVEHGSWGTWGVGAILGAPPEPSLLGQVRLSLRAVVAAIEGS